MKFFLVGLVVLFGGASHAQAGGYFAAGFGAGATLSGEMSSHFTAESLTLGRVAGGYRVGPVAVEGVLFGTSLRGVSEYVRSRSTGELDFSTVSLGIDVKYHVKIAGPLEGYGRAGLNRTWLTTPAGTDTTMDYVGAGYSVGAGVQLIFDIVPALRGALWVDFHRHVLELGDPSEQNLSGTAEMITVGLAFGAGL
jgi:hypothetical protein